ncbi:MAG: FAD-dependent oxidoreductase [Clostridiaceae bacterium]
MKKYIKFMILILLAVVGFVLVRTLKLENITPEAIKGYVLSFGIYAPLVFILVYILRSVLFFPASLFSLAGGLSFGPLWGTFYVVIGASLGAYLSFFLSRILGKDVINKWIGSRIAGTKLDKKVGFKTILALRLIPFFPFDGVSYVSGFTDVPFWKYALATTIGIIPGTFVYNYLGHSFNNPFSATFYLAIILLILFIVAPFVYKKITAKKTTVKKTKTVDLVSKPDEFKDIVLIGGGHVHINLVKNLKEYVERGYKVTLISDARYQYYSGMAASFLENIYDIDEIRFDIENICKANEINFIEKTVLKIDSLNKKVYLSDGSFVGYSILSMNIGSIIGFKETAQKFNNVYTVKPLSNLKLIKDRIKKLDQDKDIVIIGGGAAGVEVASSLKISLRNQNIHGDVFIIDGNDSVLNGFNHRAQIIATKRLNELDINMKLGSRVQYIDEDTIRLENQKLIKYDLLVIASGTEALPVFRDSGLNHDDKGFANVEKTLQSKEVKNIFAVGDCASFEDFDYVKKIGVYAIKEAPILANNIKNLIENKPLLEYLPQKKYLLIVALGDKKGLLIYDKFSFYGKIPWIIKNFIDKNFMKKAGRV